MARLLCECGVTSDSKHNFCPACGTPLKKGMAAREAQDRLKSKAKPSRSKLKLKRVNVSDSESRNKVSGKATTKSASARQIGAKCGQSPKSRFSCSPKTPKTSKLPRTPTNRRENADLEARLRDVRATFGPSSVAHHINRLKKIKESQKNIDKYLSVMIIDEDLEPVRNSFEGNTLIHGLPIMSESLRPTSSTPDAPDSPPSPPPPPTPPPSATPTVVTRPTVTKSASSTVTVSSLMNERNSMPGTATKTASSTVSVAPPSGDDTPASQSSSVVTEVCANPDILHIPSDDDLPDLHDFDDFDMGSNYFNPSAAAFPTGMAETSPTFKLLNIGPTNAPSQSPPFQSSQLRRYNVNNIDVKGISNKGSGDACKLNVSGGSGCDLTTDGIQGITGNCGKKFLLAPDPAFHELVKQVGSLTEHLAAKNDMVNVPTDIGAIRLEMGTVNANINRHHRSMATTATNFQSQVAALRRDLLNDITEDERRRQAGVAGVQNEVQSLRNEVSTIRQELSNVNTSLSRAEAARAEDREVLSNLIDMLRHHVQTETQAMAVPHNDMITNGERTAATSAPVAVPDAEVTPPLSAPVAVPDAEGTPPLSAPVAGPNVGGEEVLAPNDEVQVGGSGADHGGGSDGGGADGIACVEDDHNRSQTEETLSPVNTEGVLGSVSDQAVLPPEPGTSADNELADGNSDTDSDHSENATRPANKKTRKRVTAVPIAIVCPEKRAIKKPKRYTDD